jgi:NAD(P)-dependent dehydrogenase (short-subunit alcohol dehydrogenase family)
MTAWRHIRYESGLFRDDQTSASAQGIVTGAARDVGREIALALAAEGAAIAVNYHSSAESARAVVDHEPTWYRERAAGK